MSADPFDLARFTRAQEGSFSAAIEELRAGQKLSHWMWFVFPQLKGLGTSYASLHYGLSGYAEAAAYLAHPLLGPRLGQAVKEVQMSKAASLHALFGTPDDLKFRSSMTLFAMAAPEGPFSPALERWCDGPDPRTLALLSKAPSPGVL